MVEWIRRMLLLLTVACVSRDVFLCPPTRSVESRGNCCLGERVGQYNAKREKESRTYLYLSHFPRREHFAEWAPRLAAKFTRGLVGLRLRFRCLRCVNQDCATDDEGQVGSLAVGDGPGRRCSAGCTYRLQRTLRRVDTRGLTCAADWSVPFCN